MPDQVERLEKEATLKRLMVRNCKKCEHLTLQFEIMAGVRQCLTCGSKFNVFGGTED